MAKTKGLKVYFVGAGPGPKGLLTLLAKDALSEADVIVSDIGVSMEVLSLAQKGSKVIKVGKKDSQVTSKEGTEGISKALKGKGNIVRLVTGDPFTLSQCGEEAAFLEKKGIDYEVIPGILEQVAASSYAGVPLSRQGKEKTVTLARSKGCGLDGEVLKRSDVLAVSVYSTGLKTITKDLIKSGALKTLPVTVVKNVGTPMEVSIRSTVSEISDRVKEAGLEIPYTLIVEGAKKGKPSSLNLKSWYEEKPLFGKKVMVTRAEEQSGTFIKALTSEGALPIACPTIKINPPKSFADVDKGIKRLTSEGKPYYDWIIFTSANGVKCFAERLESLKLDVRILKGVKVCTIGPKTEKSVNEILGISVDMTPKEYVAEAVLKEFKKPSNDGIKGKKFFLPRATEAREILPQEIKKAGGTIDVAYVYKTVRPKKEAEEAKKLIKNGGVDVITFTSSSTVTNFVEGYKKGELQKVIGNTVVACIGPITRDTAIKNGLQVHIMAKDYTIEGLIEVLNTYYSKERAKN